MSQHRVNKEKVGPPLVQTKQLVNESPIHRVDPSQMMPQIPVRKRVPPSQRKTNSETGLVRFAVMNFNAVKRNLIIDSEQSKENARQIFQNQVRVRNALMLHISMILPNKSSRG